MSGKIRILFLFKNKNVEKFLSRIIPILIFEIGTVENIMYPFYFYQYRTKTYSNNIS